MNDEDAAALLSGLAATDITSIDPVEGYPIISLGFQAENPEGELVNYALDVNYDDGWVALVDTDAGQEVWPSSNDGEPQ